MRPLFDFLIAHDRIVGLPCAVPEALPFTPADVRALILRGDPMWRRLVPPELESGLLGKS
jgi:hypothetical protein